MSGNDMEWMPLLDNLSPEKVFILRGGLESVVRPATVHSGRWPWWIPAAWRGYAAMDPRCYFSTGRLRRAKQQLIDLIKQVIRKKLLTESLSAPLMGVDQLHANLTQTVTMAKSLGSEVFILDLPPISEKQFPGSSMQFQLANAMFRQLSTETGAVNVAFNLLQPDDFYLDGFHPNSQGNEKMASSIFQNVINDN